MQHVRTQKKPRSARFFFMMIGEPFTNPPATPKQKVEQAKGFLTAFATA
jgi:hypothetical protein